MSGSKFPFRGQGYDFIFIGAGCAALSLLMRMLKSGKFADKKILLIDKGPKTKNDRTWCFWEKKDGFFEEIVYKKWDKLFFLSDEFSLDMTISPYRYKMIRGIDLYNYCFKEIGQQKNIDIHYGNITEVVVHKEGTTIHIDGEMLHLDHATIFNSALTKKINKPGTINLFQHFKGWLIETPNPVFDPAKATFMDFRMDQKRGTTFGYVLPFTANKALIEYTLFTEQILNDDEYENELKLYINKFLNLADYSVIEKEFGIIPMSTGQFEFYKDSIYNIGTAGGQTKASTGYTFQFIQKQSDLIVDHLIQGKDLRKVPSTPNRFLFYDKVLLDVLHNKRVTGKDIFTTIFKKNKIHQVLKFLDNENSLKEELKIISTLPTIPFLKAALNQL